jgi:hypothetical protein
LNVRLPQALKFTEITALVPFSTATPDFVNYMDLSVGVGKPVARRSFLPGGTHGLAI